MNCQDYRHPLLHNGTSQQERTSPALSPSSVQLDNRTVANLFHFVHELAAHFKYFDFENEAVDDWRCFFEREAVAILAIIVATDLDAFDIAYIESEVKFWEDDTKAQNEEERRQQRDANYRILIQHIYELAVAIQQICTSIPKELALKSEVQNIINSQIGQAVFDNRIQNALEQLIAYDKGSGSGLGPEKYRDFIVGPEGPTRCSRAWGLYQNGGSWQDAFFCITPDDGFKEEQPPDECKENRRLRTLFMIFLQALATILVRAKVHLRRELARNRGHQPHLSLFLAFIFIFKYLQRQYNQLPQRHLDFYYAEVLRLRPQTFIADQAHVIFELAKNFDDFTLKPGTLLEAIKDSNGNPIRYFANYELVLNQARVETLKTAYLSTNDTNYRLQTAVPPAVSSEGFRPLGDVPVATNTTTWGFAIASPEYTLREGERWCQTTLTFADGTALLQFVAAVSHLEISAGGDVQDWFRLDLNDALDPNAATPLDSTSDLRAVATGFHLEVNGNNLECRLLLQPQDPPFDLAHNATDPLLQEAKHPILKFALQANGTAYRQFRDLQLVTIDIEVGVRGVRELILKTGSGAFDNTAAIPAFHQLVGSKLSTALAIGNDEVGRKRLSGCRLIFEDVDGVIAAPPGNANLLFLRDKTFGDVTGLTLSKGAVDAKELPYTNGGNITRIVLATVDILESDRPVRVAHGLLPTLKEANDGFLQIQPDIDLSNTQIPFPNFKDFFINYRAVRPADPIEPEQYYHILPFGYNQLEGVPAAGQSLAVIPPFDPAQQLGPEPEETLPIAGGNLYIGIKDLDPGQSLSLLFQVVAGSGDPRWQPPAIRWSYLKASEEEQRSFIWQEFSPEAIVRDTTRIDLSSERSLLRSGIVQFNIPEVIAKTGTTLDPGQELHWIRAAAIETEAERIAALPDLLAVHAQAALCTFINNGNSLEHLDSAMPKESITKLSERKTAVRNVQQPYASFKGKNVEVPNQFYRRVSERLRHKNRAVNLWDYQRLLLQAFPEVRHCKCITHTSDASELAPGFVTVVVFPDLRNRNGFSRTEPGIGTGEREAMEEYLRQRANLFLFCGDRIRVVNPRYELLQVSCCVRFSSGFLPKKYARILDQDLKQFLAPWAFDSSAPIFFSGAFNGSTILHYIEQRTYVDKVFDFEVYHFVKDTETKVPVSQHVDDLGEVVAVPRDTIFAGSARSIFTTFSTEEEDDMDHRIRIWGEEECQTCDKPEEFTQFDVCEDG